jgi:protease-4
MSRGTRIFLLIALVAVIVLIVAGIVAARQARGTVAQKTILELDLQKPFVEYAPESAVDRLLGRRIMTVRDIVEALDRAGDDDRVAGLVARIPGSAGGMAQAQEIRDAVLRFRSHKKFAVAFSETFGEFGPGNSGYYLATGFDKIYLQPTGAVGLNGIILEAPFLKNTLSKMGLTFKGDHRYEYKDAIETLTRTDWSAPAKEETQSILDSWFRELVQGISEGRHLAPADVTKLFNGGPYLADEALKAKLVDGLEYRDQVYDGVEKQAGGDAHFLYLEKYLDRAGRPHRSGPKVALIYGVGGVARGEGGFDPLTGGSDMGSDKVSAAFRAAIDDPDVKAIIFRIDSPGGSAVASDTIWRETVRAKKAGKPVIVTMGNLAGSGGYYIACAADKIVAQPGTITASIGVLSGKFLTSSMWDKLGVTWDNVHVGDNATMFTGTHDYTPQQWARLEAGLDQIYKDFTARVAEGRHLPLDRVLELAKGRIYSGEDAQKLGLVDDLGGFPEAIKLTKAALHLPESGDIDIRVFPRPKSLYDQFFGESPDNSQSEGQAEAAAAMVRALRPVFLEMQRLGVLPQQRQPLSMPVVPAEP